MLGCANCRTSYSIEDGVVDLRVDTGDPLPLTGGTAESDPDPDYALRVAALLGVQPPGAWIGVIEADGAVSPAVSRLLTEARFISITPGPPGAAQANDRDGDEGVSRVIAGGRLPFRPWVLRAAAVLGRPGPELLAGLERTLAPGGRLVVEGGGERIAETLDELGFTVHLRQGETVVAAASGPRYVASEGP